MKKFFHGDLVVHLVIGLGLISVVQGLSAQVVSREQSQIVTAFAARKQAANEVMPKDRKLIQILRPSEVAELLTADALIDVGDPCSTANVIYFGQEIQSSLTSSDCRLSDGSYAEFFLFDGQEGEQIQIDMRSGEFDSYLGVANSSGTWVVEDDDSGGAPHARIVATLPETGPFLVLANSYFPDEFGVFYLKLSGGPSCAFTLDPPRADIPAAGGVFTFNVTTGPRCYWYATENTTYTSSNSEGLGSGTVTYAVDPNPTNQQRQTLINVGNARFDIRQLGKLCSYTLNPSSVNIGAFESTGSFSVTTESGCFWGAQSLSIFASASGGANGNGTVNYSMMHNNGANRSATIRVEDQVSVHTFTINQAGLNCTYAVSPAGPLNVPARGYSGTYIVDTQPGCTYVIYMGHDWVDIETGLMSGPASFPFYVQPNTETRERSSAIQFSYSLDGTSNNRNTWIDQAAWRRLAPFDFDGDGKADVGVFRGSEGAWYVNGSEAGFIGVPWGQAGDKLAAADYDGDGKTDPAIFRDGDWWILNSSGGYTAVSWGFGTDTLVPADYDGDGKADPAIFRDGTFWILQSTGGYVGVPWGLATDTPVPADYDGDGKADPAIFRDGTFWILQSTGGYAGVAWGFPTDTPVPADYDGDGKADPAIFRDGTFWILQSTGGYVGVPWGLATDTPVPADYDGDGKTDPAIFRDGTFWILQSTGGYVGVPWGFATDVPVSHLSQ